MPNILSTLVTSATALRAYDQVLQVSQNNVANASTPGFVKHRQTLLAMPFDPAGGLSGGVRAGEVQGARSSYADQSVRRQTLLLGSAEQQVESLTSLEAAFDVSGKSGIARALNDLYTSFSAWGQTPGDTVARQNVLERAGDVASAFQQTAAALEDSRQETERAAEHAVDTLNSLAGRLQSLNGLALQGSAADAGLDAQIHATLEELAQYADFTAIEHENGSVDVLINGQTPLLVGAEIYPLATRLARPENATFPDGPASLRVTASDGTDITAQMTSGKLGALLDLRNRLIPSYLGDATQPGDLNRMARQFADRVNAQLTAGTLADGPPPVPGLPLFSYGADPTAVARTLEATPLQPSDLAATSPGPPYSSNGVPLALAALASPLDDADKIDGSSYSQFYGALAGRAGSELNDAKSRLAVQQSAVAQTKNLRDQMSGVSLDEEAAILIQFQRAYEATSRLITILDRLSEDTINLLR